MEKRSFFSSAGRERISSSRPSGSRDPGRRRMNSRMSTTGNSLCRQLVRKGHAWAWLAYGDGADLYPLGEPNSIVGSRTPQKFARSSGSEEAGVRSSQQLQRCLLPRQHQGLRTLQPCQVWAPNSCRTYGGYRYGLLRRLCGSLRIDPTVTRISLSLIPDEARIS